ncbi:MAG: class II glutamine amidotransferase [Oscillospiraceae bacterium]|nr:class II glutamine amidotransferase [Oscillospiraceae bacterium]
MCALFGLLDYGKRVPWKVLQKMVQALANASEVRGNHAAGIAYNKADTLTIYKRPKPAQKLHFRIPQGTSAVLGHTRLTTQGDQKFNQNNHPFRGHAGADFALAHNGVLYNDDQLRRQLNLPDTQIETDSYIAVQLIESQKNLTFDSLRYMAETVRGYFTFTLLDRADNLYFVKGESPLYLIHFPFLGLYAYSSTKEIMSAAFKQLSVKFPPYEVIAVNEGELLRIAPDGRITRDRYTVHEDYPLYSSHWYGLGSCLFDWTKQVPTTCSEDSDYLILIELSGYYGVDPEDIRYMREMGYSYDEIEDMLVNPECYGAEFALAEL